MREVWPHDNSGRRLQVSLLKVRRYAVAQYSPLQLESWSLFWRKSVAAISDSEPEHKADEFASASSVYLRGPLRIMASEAISYSTRLRMYYRKALSQNEQQRRRLPREMAIVSLSGATKPRTAHPATGK